MQLQVAIAAKKFDGVDPFPVYLHALDACGDDKLIPPIVWQNLHPLLEEKADAFLALLEKTELSKSPNLKAMMPRVIERILGRQKGDLAAIVTLFDLFSAGKNADPGTARVYLMALAGKIQTAEIAGDRLTKLTGRLEPVLTRILNGKSDDPLFFDAVLLATTVKDPRGYPPVRQALASKERSEADRLKALDALIAANDAMLLEALDPVLTRGFAEVPRTGANFTRSHGGREGWRNGAGRISEDGTGPSTEGDRTAHAAGGMEQAIDGRHRREEDSAGAVNVNQVRKLLASKDAELVKLVRATWGAVREGRNPEREQVVADMRKFLSQTKGDARKGQMVFKNFCASATRFTAKAKRSAPILRRMVERRSSNCCRTCSIQAWSSVSAIRRRR